MRCLKRFEPSRRTVVSALILHAAARASGRGRLLIIETFNLFMLCYFTFLFIEISI
jgi:hypothetical protein